MRKYKILKAKKGYIVENKEKNVYGIAGRFKTKRDAQRWIRRNKAIRKNIGKRPL